LGSLPKPVTKERMGVKPIHSLFGRISLRNVNYIRLIEPIS
jgi:hypothetical protein